GLMGTVSWVRFDEAQQFSADEFVFLIGDNNQMENNDRIRVTMHHNFFNGTRYRHPLITGAWLHSFNNVIRWQTFGMQIRRGDGPSEIVSEHDIFDASVAGQKD